MQGASARAGASWRASALAAVGGQRSHGQEAGKATPPSGVTAPSQCVPVSASRYRLPEKARCRRTSQTGGRQQGEP